MRRPAHFTFRRPSEVWGEVVWRVTATDQGIEAKRSFDRRHLTLSWERLLELAIIHGQPTSEELAQAQRRRTRRRK